MISLMTELLKFPKDFIFGASTAAYQIEGSTDAGGRGLSVWDTFSHKKGNVANNHNGDRACEHYIRYADDVALMKKMGLDAYRFSISWSRILPQGRGRVNQAGLDFYHNLVDSLIEAGIEPYVTLFHWDFPEDLQQAYGGFLSRQAAEDYAAYVEVVVKSLGSKVKHWITVNEPWEHGCLGYVMGEHGPGLRRPWKYMQVMHHQLLAHGMGVKVIREHCPDAKVGIAVSITPIHPVTDSSLDRQSADIANEFMNFVTLDPILKGRYPQKLAHAFRWFSPDIHRGDMALISQELDFVGINNYQREFARHCRWVPFLKSWIVGGTTVADGDFVKDGVQHTSMGWEVYPLAIYESLKWLQDKYHNPPVLITENGAAFDDVVRDGVVDDPKRIAYFRDYLAQVQKVMDEGGNVQGYFAWSLLDNFEWAAGYNKRFGLIHVNYETQERIIKQSGYWYQALIQHTHLQET